MTTPIQQAIQQAAHVAEPYVQDLLAQLDQQLDQRLEAYLQDLLAQLAQHLEDVRALRQTMVPAGVLLRHDPEAIRATLIEVISISGELLALTGAEDD